MAHFHRTLCALTVLATTVLFLPLVLHSQTLQWESATGNLSGAIARTIGFTPNGGVYLATAQNCYRVDAGGGWRNENWRWLPRCFTTTPGGVMLAGTDNGIFRSTDNGNTWEHVLQMKHDYLVTNKGFPVTAILAYTDSICFASAEGFAPFYSENGGKSWRVRPNMNEPQNIHQFIRTANGSIYALQQGNEPNYSLLITSDTGKSWRYTLADSFGGRFSESPQSFIQLQNGRIIIGGGIVNNVWGTYYSDNYGKDWVLADTAKISALTLGMEGVIYGTVAFSYDVNGTIISGGLYRSTDNGQSWQRLTNDPPELIAVDPSNRVWINNGYHVLMSADRGNSWTDMTLGLPEPNVTALNATGPNYIYALIHNPGYVDGGYFTDFYDEVNALYRSSDRGNSWQLIRDSIGATLLTDSLGGLYIETFDFTPDPDPQTGEIPTENFHSVRLLRSGDHGETWQELASYGGTTYLRYIDIQVSSINDEEGTIAVSLSAHAIIDNDFTNDLLISRDAGNSWHSLGNQLSEQIPISTTIVLQDGSILIGVHPPNDNNTLSESEYGPTFRNGGLFRITYNGEEELVEALVESIEVYGLAYRNSELCGIINYLPVHPDFLDKNGILQSFDWGRTWEKIGLSWQNLRTPTNWNFLFEFNASGHLFVEGKVQSNSRLFRNSPDRERWDTLSMSSSLHTGIISNSENLLFRQRLGSRIGADSLVHSVIELVHSTDNGSTWVRADPEPLQQRYTTFAYSPTGDIYAGTSAGGVYRTTFEVGSSGLAEPTPEGHSAALQLAPVPATDRIHCTYAGAQAAGNPRITITDILGREVVAGSMEIASSGTYLGTVELKDLPGGIYVCTVTQGEHRSSATFVKR